MAVVVGGEIRRARELLRGVSVSLIDFLEKSPFLMTGEGFPGGGGEGKREGSYAKEGNVVGRAAEGGESGGGEAAVVVVGREPIA